MAGMQDGVSFDEGPRTDQTSAWVCCGCPLLVSQKGRVSNRTSRSIIDARLGSHGVLKWPWGFSFNSLRAMYQGDLVGYSRFAFTRCDTPIFRKVWLSPHFVRRVPEGPLFEKPLMENLNSGKGLRL